MAEPDGCRIDNRVRARPDAAHLPHRILGIDPGSRRTGFGLIDTNGQRSLRIASGTLQVGAHPWPERLKRIFDGVAAIVSEHRPHDMAVEQLIFARDPAAALKIGQARGAALCAGLSSGVNVHEYSPKAVKRAVVGSGAAEKSQVQHMIRVLLGLVELPGEDEADALAIALCHAHSMCVPGRGRATASWRDWRP
ncbi:crossover junction endodeoxyribonuclease RuvC [Thiocapsa imhoffii]|uniref:Crossover junction endodeoxyribonuclease RuvC n=1 Tax=Thiocapsa imhoffii TaxID=382777 RepID=A0A9X1B7U7_9GAMM|nr:crossover junction endodeoxyribonuclease RuvC [Thiocapsa imhoffii]MBK1643385.1 crossover junction endodeoxyribonuclease RuvC [Thiocapsa imhoffii]